MSNVAQCQDIISALKNGPKSTRELGISAELARQMRGEGFVEIDPDMFPDEYVPFNPMVVRLCGDIRPWPGWSNWNL